MSEKRIAVYHRILKSESFETAAKDLFNLLVNTQKKQPNKPRTLYVDIEGHRNKEGGFDKDMFELQKEFGIGFIAQFFQEIHFPLYDIENKMEQNNHIPEKLILINGENKRDMSLDELYIENYSNTEFIHEDDVYKYLKRFSKFIREYNEWNVYNESAKNEKSNKFSLMCLWHRHLKDIINEIFNNFIHGNLISTAAMTRTLIECYVYISILIKENNSDFLEDWYFCSLMSKIKKDSRVGNELVGLIKK